MDRRTFLVTGAAALAGARMARAGGPVAQARLPRPTPSQMVWQRDELALFLHFGVNTFTDREWGDGREDPRIFAPTNLDAREWARVARAAGFRAMVLTAKHHDGFCLWPTRTTAHSVASSPWRGGRGDLVKEFTEACRAEGLRAGLYLSPWDRNNPTYGDSPRYNDLYVDQLRELLTGYGEIHEVWFDGANGEGPNGRKQEYDWPRVWGEVRRMQPNAVMFSDAGPDVRWCGNESGTAGDPNWSAVDPAVVPVPGISGTHVIDALQHGDASGSVWRPAEADTSIRPGWFHHPAEDARVRTVDNLVALYFRSVGRNAKLLLNVPPTRDGVLHPTDVERLMGFAERRRQMFAEDLVSSGPHAVEWHEDAGGMVGTIDLARPVTASLARFEERIEIGQQWARFSLSASAGDGAFEEIASGLTIGYARLVRFPSRRIDRLRLAVTAAARVSVTLDAPPVQVRLYA